MTQFLKTFQEEQDKEFDETFIVLNSGQILFRSQLQPGVVKPAENIDGIMAYIHSREELLLKRLGEEVEKKKRDGESLSLESMGYNEALDDVLKLL